MDGILRSEAHTSQTRMVLPNVVARYSIVCDAALVGGDLGTLEVGSGPQGLAAFSRARFVACDLAFPSSLPANMLAVRASACHLPFSDRSFDTVISLDMLEHIPLGERDRAVQEIVRVARYRAIIGFPSGKLAYWADRLLAWFYRLRHLPVPDWLEQHSEPFPSRSTVQWALRPVDGVSVCWTWVESLPMHLLIMILETSPRATRFLAKALEQHMGAWLGRFRRANWWPCYRLLCIITRTDEIHGKDALVRQAVREA